MISFLKGILVEKRPPELVVDVQGVGYEITVSMNAFYDLPELGKVVQIPTYLIVREDAHLLYGFRDQKERSLFKLLLKVSGVGPKMAITLLSSIDPDGFVRCIQLNDTAALVRLPGIGKKTAERLVVEMRDRLDDWALELSVSNTANQKLSEHQVQHEAISALLTLGYKQPEAKRAVDNVVKENATSEELIRLALKSLAR